MKDAQARTIRLRDYRPPRFLIEATELHFDLFEDRAEVKSKLSMRRNPAYAARNDDVLVMHGEQLDLISLRLNGKELKADDYHRDGERLSIPKFSVLLSGTTDADPFTVECHTRIEPQHNTALEGLYKSSGMFCTQCEAEGFRRITYYLDRPDVMSRFTTTVCAEQARYPMLLSNGNPVESGTVAGDPARHWVKWQDPFPKPCYLFALVAGDLKSLDDSFTTRSGREVAIRIFVEEKDLDKCGHAMASLKKAMAWDEKAYGREYDLDIFMIVAVDDFNMGAMENKGLNIFNSSCVLAKPETATDAAFQRIEEIVAHEYFHNWSGNRVTCRDWFQLSLKEGFTVFRDSEFTADMNSRTVKRVEDSSFLKTVQFAEDAGPLAHSVQPDSYMEISNFYTSTVYEKGAEVVRMLSQIVGPEDFRRGCDLYFSRHDGEAVTIEEFVKVMEEVSGTDLRQFRLWYSQAGTPLLDLEGSHDPQRAQYTLSVKQECPPTPGQTDKQPMHIPLRMGLLDKQGRALPLRLQGDDGGSDSARGPSKKPCYDRVLNITGRHQRFIFEGIESEPVPSLLRSFSAPVRLRFPWSADDLAFLAVHDSDGFNKWNASQELALRALRMAMQSPPAAAPAVDADGNGDGDPEQLFRLLLEAYRAAIEKALADGHADKALIGHILTLPSEDFLIQQTVPADVEGVYRVREAMLDRIAAELEAGFAKVYEANQDPRQEQGKFSVSTEAMARRALKNQALGYLVRRGALSSRGTLSSRGACWLETCVKQFREADNMTDRQAALRLLVECRVPEAKDPAKEALAEFYQRWRREPLVLDQWFSVQACCRLPGGLARVKQLTEHPDFSLKNPNKVRAVIGAFCSHNHINFHGADGGGYAFLASQVLKLDKLNPQIAARSLTPLSRWRRFDEGRQKLMLQALQRIKAAPDLSKDVYEVVEKSTRQP